MKRNVIVHEPPRPQIVTIPRMKAGISSFGGSDDLQSFLRIAKKRRANRKDEDFTSFGDGARESDET